MPSSCAQTAPPVLRRSAKVPQPAKRYTKVSSARNTACTGANSTPPPNAVASQPAPPATVMDGPFFSLMPFGQTGLHSLTSVTFTPHETSYDAVATFPCQQQSEGKCRPGSLYNCNECPAKPQSAWPYMSQLARKYLKEEYGFAYQGSLFSMKPILKASEIDDSRPTVVRVMNTEPMLVSVLSGKINTVYDLDEVLNV